LLNLCRENNYEKLICLKSDSDIAKGPKKGND
jgi:hypothetical protein